MPVDKSARRIREMFGEISPRYDFLNHFLSVGTDFYWRWRAVRAVPLEPGVPLLDVCTGTGDLAIAYWKQGAGRVPVVGSDFAHEMLRLARDKSKNKQRKQPAATEPLCFLEADTQQLPFHDNLFQLVSVAFGLRNVTDTETGLREMIRVCKPSGHVLVLEFTMPTGAVIGRLYRCYFRHVLPRIGQLLSGNRQSAYNYLPDSVSEFPQGESLVELMRQSGLEAVCWKSLTFGTAALYWGKKPKIAGKTAMNGDSADSNVAR
jgi:demethylmenaquinone methyltransferase/2-methoxy-6-polyprenyl-1,4-benzoquinol methylase